MIGVEGFVTPKHHLSPKIGVLTALVHRCVRLKVLLNVEFIFFERKFDVFRISICSKNSVKVPAHTVLLIVESIEVGSSNCIDVLCQ